MTQKFKGLLKILLMIALPMMLTLSTSLFAKERSFKFINKLSFGVWAGNWGRLADKVYLLDDGGFYLAPGASRSLTVPDGWSSVRIWGRTGCKFDASGYGNCETGNCSQSIKCSGTTAESPVTLAEFTLGTEKSGSDWYDVSLVDGYNLPITIKPTGSFNKAGLSDPRYDCGTAGCVTDLNVSCPPELQLKNSSGKVIACISACRKFNTDQFCCRGSYGTPDKCPPYSYSKTFNAACPQAYSYAYDDDSSTFQCIQADYEITFGYIASLTNSSNGKPVQKIKGK